MRQFNVRSNIVDHLIDAAERQPDRIAYRFVDAQGHEETTTYGQLRTSVLSLAEILSAHTSIGDRTILMYPQGLRFVEALFACLAAGCVAVPIPSLRPGREQRHLARLVSIVADATPSLLLTTAGLRTDLVAAAQTEAALGSQLTRLTSFATDTLRPGSGPGRLVRRHHDVAFLQYTSGSTGRPRGVMVTHRAALENSECLRTAFRYSSDSVSVMWVPNYHDDGLVQGSIQPVFSNTECVLLSPFEVVQNPRLWLQTISRYRATHSGGPDFMYALATRKILEQERDGLDLKSWRVAYNAAEPVRLGTLQQFDAKFAPYGFRWSAFHPAYGLAECTLLVATRRANADLKHIRVDRSALERGSRLVETTKTDGTVIVSCGKPVGATALRIVDPLSRQPVPPAHVGEVWVKSPSVSSGYWNRPEDSADTFQAFTYRSDDGPYVRTGDLGALCDGELFVTGRLKDLLVVNGRNIYPQDVEAVAEMSHRDVRLGCTAAVAIDRDGGECILLVAEVKPAADLEDIVKRIRSGVANGMDLIVWAVALIKPGTIPKTSSGKLQRSETRRRFESGALDMVFHWQFESASRNDDGFGGCMLPTEPESVSAWIERWLAATLQLDPDRIDRTSSFNALGLDSVTAVNLAGELGRASGHQLAATAVWEYPSIEALAQQVARLSATHPAVVEQAARHP